MFSHILKVLIVLVLSTETTPSNTVFGVSSEKFAQQYNERITALPFCKEFPRLRNFLKLPQKDEMIELTVLSKNLNSSFKTSKLVRNAVLASLFSNFFISKNNSFADYFIGCPAAVIQSLLGACVAANLLAKKNNLGILALILGQNALQIEIVFFDLLFKQPLRIFENYTNRALISFLVRTCYPIISILNLDAAGLIAQNQITQEYDQRSIDGRLTALTKKGILNTLCFLNASANLVFPDDYFSTPNLAATDAHVE